MVVAAATAQRLLSPHSGCQLPATAAMVEPATAATVGLV